MLYQLKGIICNKLREFCLITSKESRLYFIQTRWSIAAQNTKNAPLTNKVVKLLLADHLEAVSAVGEVGRGGHAVDFVGDNVLEFGGQAVGTADLQRRYPVVRCLPHVDGDLKTWFEKAPLRTPSSRLLRAPKN